MLTSRDLLFPLCDLITFFRPASAARITLILLSDHRLIIADHRCNDHGKYKSQEVEHRPCRYDQKFSPKQLLLKLFGEIIKLLRLPHRAEPTQSEGYDCVFGPFYILLNSCRSHSYNKLIHINSIFLRR